MSNNILLDIKDAIYLIIYIVSMMSLFLSNKYYQRSQGSEIKRISKLIYDDKGALNIVSECQCKQRRDEVFTAIRRNEKVVEMMLVELKEIKENIIILKVYFGIKTPDGIKKD